MLRRACLIWFLLTLLAIAAARALTPLVALRVSPDVAAELGGTTLADEGLGEDDLAGDMAPIGLGALPAEADLAAYHLLGDGDQLLVFDAVVTLPGPLAVGPADVVRFDGATYTLELAGASAGIPAGARIDALAAAPVGGFLISLDVDADLGGLAVDDADLVRVGAGAAALWLAATDAGIPAELDVDGLQLLPNGHLLLTFETGGTILGLDFADEDVLELDPLGPSWELAFDGDAAHAGWVAADLDALWALAGPPAPPPAAGAIRFTHALFVADETEAFAVITAERVGDATGAVGVTFFTADLSALEGADYLGAGGTLAWADGEAGVKSFDVPLLDDVDVEGDENVRLVLTGPTGGAVLGNPAVAQLVIRDDETPEVTMLEIPTLGDAGLLALIAALALAGVSRLRR